LKVRFLYPASVELDGAITYYNHQLPGLGFRFYQEVSSSIDRIKILPEAWTKIGKNTRRCILKNFPYALHFVKDTEKIIITAVAHLHRNPEHFQKRII
jgi:hypothetical protein